MEGKDQVVQAIKRLGDLGVGSPIPVVNQGLPAPTLCGDRE